jgi:predicted nuclease of restriction endonuclease-like (RecB) superfamily
MKSKSPTSYISVLNELKEKIRNARLKATLSVNLELLRIYWEIGKSILQQQEAEGWGAKIIDRLAVDLKTEFPDMKGLSVRNLKYMTAFAEAYPEFIRQSLKKAQNIDNQSLKIVQVPLAQLDSSGKNEFVQTTLAQLSWYHHITLLGKIKDPQTRLFYIQETIQNGWSRDVMVHQIEAGLHNRKGKIISNFKNTIAPEQSELVQQLFKDPYKFDFIYLGKEAKERDLEDALTSQLTKFLLELGQHFAFMGRQYKLMVGDKEYFIDLLFYHTRLKRHIVIELKIDEFKPEYKGKMEFYLSLADEHLKQLDDEKSIGLILCKTKDGLVVEYALRDSSKPIGIAEYSLGQALPANLKSDLPTIEELEQEMEKEVKEFQKPVDQKLDRVKEMIKALKQPKVKEKRSPKTSARIFIKVVLPLRDAIKKSLAKISKEFESTEIMIWMDGQGHKTDTQAQAHLKTHKEFNEFRIEIRLNGFKPAGTKAFYVNREITIKTESYFYAIGFGRNQNDLIIPERLYHQVINKQEIENIAEQCAEKILDEIAGQIGRIQKEKDK